MVVASEARTGQEVLALARTRFWDVVVLDLSMPGRDKLDVLQKLRQAPPKLPILVLSMYPEEQYAIRALRLGASGYMAKQRASKELIRGNSKGCHGRPISARPLGGKAYRPNGRTRSVGISSPLFFQRRGCMFTPQPIIPDAGHYSFTAAESEGRSLAVVKVLFSSPCPSEMLH